MQFNIVFPLPLATVVKLAQLFTVDILNVLGGPESGHNLLFEVSVVVPPLNKFSFGHWRDLMFLKFDFVIQQVSKIDHDLCVNMN